MKQVVFNQEYYGKIMEEFGYDPLKFERIDFSLGDLTKEDLQRGWLCHHGAKTFAENLYTPPISWSKNWLTQDYQSGEEAIVSTGFGLTGIPHVGTLSQILRSIALQKAGVPVNMVLGDLDAYNGKAKPLEETLRLADKYEKFVLALGFDPEAPSNLRAQHNELEVLRTSYIIGKYMDDSMFNKSEEDLHEFYSEKNKVDREMSYRRKLSLNLMTADFIHLHLNQGFKYILVTLGIDEHKYVQFGIETVRKIKLENEIKEFNMQLSGLYSPMIKGLYNYPKMSKSFPESGISVDMNPKEIKDKIMKGEGEYDKPENNVVYQMMAGASYLTPKELKENYEACLKRGEKWERAKKEYTDMLAEICSKWVR